MSSLNNSVFAHKEKKTMTVAVLVSLLLHGALALAALSLFSKAAEEIKTDTLLIELFGMVADRQKEASAPAAATTTPTPPQKTKQAEEMKAQRPVKAIKAKSADSPIQIARQEEQTAPSAKASDNVKASDLQKQQTLSEQDKDIEELKKYQARVIKKITSNLVYSAEASKRGYEGLAIVRLIITENGMIQPGSLAIAHSSGYELLDANALKSARDSEPFERPPRSLRFDEIGLGFFRK